MHTPLHHFAPDHSDKNETAENQLSEAQHAFETVSNNPSLEENYDIQYVAVLSSN